jgi:hypothetical protein
LEIDSHIMSNQDEAEDVMPTAIEVTPHPALLSTTHFQKVVWFHLAKKKLW